MNDQPAQSRPLPNHERHRRVLLDAIAAESAHEQAADGPARSTERRPARAGFPRPRSLQETGPSRLRARFAPVLAALAVILVAAAGIGVHALLRPASQPGRPGARPVTAATRTTTAAEPATASPSAVGGGEWSVTQKYTVTAPVSRLIVNGTAGSVAVAGGPGSDVSVTAKIYYHASRPTVSDTVSGRTLTLGYSGCADCGVAFTVTVPRAAGVTVSEQTGRVTVANLAGNVSVNDDTGMVTVGSLTGDVSVQVGSGSIGGTGLSAARASFRDSLGTIDVAFTAPPSQLTAVTGTGMVSVQVPSGTTYQVNASSQLGSVDDSVPQSPAATHVITASTGIGLVSVSTG